MSPSVFVACDHGTGISSCILRIIIALDEMHSSAVLSLVVFFFREVAVVVGVGASVERDQPAPAQTAPQQAGFGSQTERLLFYLRKPRTKGSRFALARLIVKYGYYITGQSGMPYAIYQYSSTIARREQDAKPPNSHQ